MVGLIIFLFVAAFILMVGQELFEGAIYIGLVLALFYFGFKLIN